MLYYKHRIAALHKFVEQLHKNTDILKMQPRGGLVENKQRLTGVFFCQLRGKFHTLILAPRKSGRRLSELHISQANILQHLDFR